MDNMWYKDAVFYHIYTMSLAKAPFYNDYTARNNAFTEIAEWLPHIKSLGCNAVLFGPLLLSRSHGYDVIDYYKVDNRIGVNEDFAALVQLFHKHGVRVVLDVPFNHCGRGFHAFEELRSGKREYAEWFDGVDFTQNSPLGDPFTYNTWSGHFELAKFNLKNETVREYLINAAVFLINLFGIDGMRLDAANELDFDFMRGLRRECARVKPDFWLMGEVVHGDYSRWVNEETLHSVTNYMLFKALYSSNNDRNLFELAHCAQHSVPENGLPLYSFLDNHDQPRIVSNIENPEHLSVLYALLFTLPGVPSVYYGSEFGITGRKDGESDQPLRPYIDIRNPDKRVPWLADFIRKLADIRHRSAALRYGSYRKLLLEYRKPLVFERAYNDERVFVVINIENNEEYVNLSPFHNGGLTDLFSGNTIQRHDTHRIHSTPCTARILRAE